MRFAPPQQVVGQASQPVAVRQASQPADERGTEDRQGCLSDYDRLAACPTTAGGYFAAFAS